MHFWVGLVIAIVAAVWVASDARKRGMNSVGWAIGTFLLLILFLPLYLILRKPLVMNPAVYPPGVGPLPGSRMCPNCGQYYQGNARFCPACGAPQP